MITGEPDNVNDGTYSTNLSFNAYLSGNTAPTSKAALFPFGRYSGNKPILWKVLTVDTANNRALLLVNEPTSEMKQPYHANASENNQSDYKWSNSTVKTWLKNTFINNFTTAEQNRVLNVKIDDSSLENMDTSSDLIINAGGDDKFFILSLKDTENTAYFSGDNDRKAFIYGSVYPAFWLTNGVMEKREYKQKSSNTSAWSAVFNFGNFFDVIGSLADAYMDSTKYEAVSTYLMFVVGQSGSTGLETTVTEENGAKKIVQKFTGFAAYWDSNVYIRPAMWLNTAGSVAATLNAKSVTLNFEKASDYALIPPEGNSAMNYTKGVYNSIGTLSVTAGANSSSVQNVVVEVQYSGKLTNTQDSGQNVTYELIQGSEADYNAGTHKVLKNGDKINFNAASIKAGTASVAMGAVISSNPYDVSDGNYSNDITFKAVLNPLPVAGEIYTFGKYNNEAITWRVVTADKANSRALLVSEYILEKTIKFNNSQSYSWVNSSLRSTLNGSFLNGFTDEEKARMIKVNAVDERVAGINNYSNVKTSDTIINASGTDLVFLLSVQDIITYFPNQTDEGRYSYTKDNTTYPTAYWLRTGDEGSYPYTLVIKGGNKFGAISVDDPTKYNTNNDEAVGMRPAIWLKF